MILKWATDFSPGGTDPDYPANSDVRLSVVFAHGAHTGTLPPEVTLNIAQLEVDLTLNPDLDVEISADNLTIEVDP